MVAPLRSFSLEVLSEVPAALVFSTTFSATFWPLPTAFSVASFAALVTLAEDVFALLPAFFAEVVTFSLTFFAAALVVLAALAAARTFLATAAVSPAFFKSPALALAILATCPICAFNFFAVASPTPGSEVSAEPFPLLPSFHQPNDDKSTT